MAFLRSIVTAKTTAIAAVIPAAAFAVSSISSSSSSSSSSHFERLSKNLKFASNPNLRLSFAKNIEKSSPPSALHMDAPSSNHLTSVETEFMVDMSCQGCVKAVKSKLQTVEGVKNVDVDLDNQVVRVLGSSPVKILTEALEQTGRKARLIGQGVPDDFLISAAVAEFKGPDIFGVVRLAQVNMELTRIEANFSGLSPGKHAWSINEFGDLTRGAASTGKLYSPPLGDLGTLEVDVKGEAFYSGAKEKLRVADLIGRAIAVYSTEDKSDPGLKAAVIARSAGVGENYKKLCTCDGTTIWEATNKL
ncbi:copper chaperone for superoxide dismutase, chloroplastic/cytosolic-like isoform X1 [Nicotiana tabacum]|uniref:Copper chaperone for superoxide dismutase, chloroplastic/cytosolic-like isoform X1 n=2 Tax=Nicotiana TaxID=4085 RepID=A0AC58S4C6_TOBAC|nr:PREDICTED: copper chaperone for superoxide dismutase, chloroplastic/cytosolic isoform X2 [Nicotiana sylvestris]